MGDIYKSAGKPYRKSEAGRYGEKDEELPKDDPLSKPVDVLARPDSLADKLRKRRRAYDAGDEIEYEAEKTRKQRGE